MKPAPMFSQAGAMEILSGPYGTRQRQFPSGNQLLMGKVDPPASSCVGNSRRTHPKIPYRSMLYTSAPALALGLGKSPRKSVNAARKSLCRPTLGNGPPATLRAGPPRRLMVRPRQGFAGRATPVAPRGLGRVLSPNRRPTAQDLRLVRPRPIRSRSRGGAPGSISTSPTPLTAAWAAPFPAKEWAFRNAAAMASG
jgi:hypothetical protein